MIVATKFCFSIPENLIQLAAVVYTSDLLNCKLKQEASELPGWRLCMFDHIIAAS
jgi:hypothetical protein